MQNRSQSSYMKKLCPACGGAVIQGQPVLGLRSWKYRCSSCGSTLNVRPTLRVLWAFVVAAVAIAMLFFLHWLQPNWPRTVLATLNYGIAGGAMAYSFNLVYRGMVFRASKQG